MNEYNAQNTASYQEKKDNILNLSMQYKKSQLPLSEEDMSLANSYATLAINNK